MESLAPLFACVPSGPKVPLNTIVKMLLLQYNSYLAELHRTSSPFAIFAFMLVLLVFLLFALLLIFLSFLVP